MLSESFLVVFHIWPYLVIVMLLGVILSQRGVERSKAIIAAVLVCGLISAIFMSFHLRGLDKVSDLRHELEVAVEAANRANDMSPADPRSFNTPDPQDVALKIVRERNRRLSEIGLCANGAWWVSKSTGEPWVVSTNSVYTWCGKYGY